MNSFFAFLFVIILAIGSFIPYSWDDSLTIYTKSFVLFLFLFACFLRKIFVTKTIVFYLVIVFLIFFISSLKSLDLYYAIEKLIGVTLVVYGLYYVFIHLLNDLGIPKALALIIKHALLILVMTLIYKFIFGFWDRNVRFFLNGPIVFAWLMGVYALISLHLAIKERNIFYYIIFFIFGLSVFWTESKGAILAFIISSAYYCFSSSGKFIKSLLLAIPLILYSTWNIIITFLEEITDGSRLSAFVRILKNDTNSVDAGSIDSRHDMLIESLNMINDNLIFGIGLGSYKILTVNGFPYPHNIHLEVFLECGLIPGIIYIIFIVYAFSVSKPLFQCLILFFIVASSFSGDITYLRFLILFLIIGLYTSKTYLGDRNEKNMYNY